MKDEKGSRHPPRSTAPMKRPERDKTSTGNRLLIGYILVAGRK